MNGSGRPVIGITPIVIADVLEQLPEQHGEHAGAQVGAEHVAGQVGDPPDPHSGRSTNRPRMTAQPTSPNCSPTAENGKSAH